MTMHELIKMIENNEPVWWTDNDSEDPEAIKRREERERFVKGIKEEILSKVEDIQYYKADNERCKMLLKEDIDKEDKKIFRERIKRNNRYIMNLKIAVKELKFVIGE